jgi:hypothetical protein
MKWLFDGKYALFVARKDIITTKGFVYYKKGEAIFGGGIAKYISKDHNDVIIQDPDTGEVIFKGINYVDCVFKYFCLYSFIHWLYSEYGPKYRAYTRYIRRLADL